MLARHLLSQQDDVTPSDILAYSTLGTKTEDDDAIFESGGAIMEALEKVDPGITSTVQKETARTKAIASKPKSFKIEPVVVKNNKIVKTPAAKATLPK